MLYRPLPPQCPQCKLPVTSPAPFCSRCKFDLRYEHPGRPKRGECTYCAVDSPGIIKDLTEEHLFGKWLKKQFPPLKHKVRRVNWRPERHGFESPMHAREELIEQSPYDTQVPHVCKDCNGGWMSLLQRQAKPILTRMITEKWEDLTTEENKTVARWASMVVVNHSKLSRTDVPTTAQLRSLKNGEVPIGFSIYAIQVKGRGMAGFIHSHPVVEIGWDDSDGNSLTISSTMFCIERVAFLVNHCEYVGRAREMVQKLGSGFVQGTLPRMIYPEPTAAAQSVDIFLSEKLLRECGLEWLSPIPVTDYSDILNYTIRYESKQTRARKKQK